MKYYKYDYEEGKLANFTIRGRSRKILRNAVEFFASKIFTHNSLYKIHFFINVKNKLEQSALGYCSFNNDFNEPEFDIEILNTKDIDDMLSTLAHEMVHARQYYRKELKFSNNKNYWKKQEHSEDDGINSPWEREAYINERILLDLFRDNYDRKEKS